MFMIFLLFDFVLPFYFLLLELGIILHNKIPASMKQEEYGITVAYTKSGIVACNVNAKQDLHVWTKYYVCTLWNVTAAAAEEQSITVLEDSTNDSDEIDETISTFVPDYENIKYALDAVDIIYKNRHSSISSNELYEDMTLDYAGNRLLMFRAKSIIDTKKETKDLSKIVSKRWKGFWVNLSKLQRKEKNCKSREPREKFKNTNNNKILITNAPHHTKMHTQKQERYHKFILFVKNTPINGW